MRIKEVFNGGEESVDTCRARIVCRLYNAAHLLRNHLSLLGNADIRGPRRNDTDNAARSLLAARFNRSIAGHDEHAPFGVVFADIAFGIRKLGKLVCLSVGNTRGKASAVCLSNPPDNRDEMRQVLVLGKNHFGDAAPDISPRIYLRAASDHIQTQTADKKFSLVKRYLSRGKTFKDILQTLVYYHRSSPIRKDWQCLLPKLQFSDN